MDQTVVAGVGNVYRAEVLFRHGVDPYRAGRALARADWDAIWADLAALMREGVRLNRIDTVRPEHTPEAMGRPPRVDDHGGEVYVYRRAGHALPGVRHARSARRNWSPATSSGAPAASAPEYAGPRRAAGGGAPAPGTAVPFPASAPQKPCGSQGARPPRKATDAAASAPGRSSVTSPAAASAARDVPPR